MNFGSLMYAAQSNATHQQQDQVRCYKTTFAPPKKEAPKQRNLSANVQKFLARKEEEKRQKEVEEKKKRDGLLSLRSQDKMSVKRVSTMLKRTKSANKSVMEDAVDDVNTVVTMAGPSQCDEDDYGYVSQEASSFYNKLMDKYSNMPPEEDKFSKSKKVAIKDLNAAKERVKATLNRIEEEEMLPRKRKRKSKEEKPGGGEDDDFIDDEIRYRDDKETKKEEEEPKSKKPKRPPPPPMDFSQLLKIAEQKQYEPVVIEKKPVDDEDDKPMTKKQRLEYLREKEARIQRERRELEDKLRRKPSASMSSANKRRSPSPSENSLLRSSLQQKVNKSSNESSSIPRIPKINHSSESGSRNSKPSSEPPTEKLQSIKIPKLSDREKAQKPPGNSSSSSSSFKPVPPSVAEEMLKKSSNVWSKPCNLSPVNSPNHKTNNKLSSNGSDRHRNSLDNRSTASSNQNLDRRKDTPEKQLVRKPSSSSVSKPSSSDLDRRKELSDDIDREKLRKEIERKKLLMKQKLANDRNHISDKNEEKSNRIDNQPSRKNESSTIIKNGLHKNNSIRNNDQQQKSRMNGDAQQKSRSDGDIQHKSRMNGDAQQKSRSDGDIQHRSRMNGDAQQKCRSDGDSQQKNIAKKGNKVLVDLFGDDFPNENNSDKSNSNSSSNKPTVLNGSSKLSGKPNPVKTSLSSSSRDYDDRLSKPSSSSIQSSKNVDSKSKSLISSSQNMKQPNRQDDRSVSNNKVQPRQFPPNDLKSKSQLNEKSRSGDVKPRQFPPADVKPRQFPPPDMRPRQFPPPDVRRNSRPVQRRPVNEFIVTDDEDEYDSEMDDFIDDTDYGSDVNISKEISQIFGYDKKRYKNIDDDDIEEANFAQMMKEEVRSTRIGIQEDLEEYLRDKAEKKRAVQRKLQKLSEMKKKRR